MKKRWLAMVLGLVLSMSLPGAASVWSAEFSDGGSAEVSETETFGTEAAGTEEGETESETSANEESSAAVETGEASQEEPAGDSQEQEAEPQEEVEDVTEEETAAGDVQEAAQEEEEPAFDDSSLEIVEEEESAPTDTLESGKILNAWQWDAIAGAFRYYNGSGQTVPITQLNARAKQEGTYTGYFKINGDYYCLNDDGIPQTGEIVLTANGVSSTYYFQETADASGITGRMFLGWRQIQTSKGAQWIYYDTGKKNEANVGKLTAHGIIATTLDTSVMGNSSYLVSADGYILKSTMKKAANGKYYFTDKKGRVYKNRLVTYKSKRYYVGKNGARVTWKNQWHRCSGAGNRIYYFGSTPGRIVKKTGWQRVTVNGKFYGWFNFGTAGNHFKSKLLKAGYYFKESGALASGFTKVGSNYYYFTPSTSTVRNGKMVKGQRIDVGNVSYYAYKSGVLRQNGWQTIQGNYYYFKNYKMVKNTFVKRKGTYGYLDSTGRFTTGWVIVDDDSNKVKYINPSRKGFVANTSMWIDGLLYYFDENGYRINDVSDRVSGPYSVVVDRVNGVMTIYNSDRTIPVKSVRISVGAASTPTPTGTYTLTSSARWQPLMGNSWGQYGTHVTAGIYIHSVPSGSPSIYELPSGYYMMLGQPASHGCIRVNVADAKWIYDNCNGATITITDKTAVSEDSLKGPLGKPALVPLRAPYTFDPTDPEVS